jgi:hypothetical protein
MIKSVLFTILLTIPLQAKDAIPSNWFGESVIGNSKFWYHLYLYESRGIKKFIFHELSLNPYRKYEELRIQGKLDNQLSLQTENCALYAKKELEKRWALIRAFDCNHLLFEVNIERKTLKMSEKSNAYPTRILHKITKNDGFLLKIIDSNVEKSVGWGIQARRILKQKKGFSIDLEGRLGSENKIISPRESIVFFQNSSELGSYIWVPEQSSASFLE